MIKKYLKAPLSFFFLVRDILRLPAAAFPAPNLKMHDGMGMGILIIA